MANIKSKGMNSEIAPESRIPRFSVFLNKLKLGLRFNGRPDFSLLLNKLKLGLRFNGRPDFSLLLNKLKLGLRSPAKYIYHFFIGLMLLFLCWFVWKIGFGIPSSYTDLSYHLATAQAFVRANGIVTWDFWESLPLGRPHNYPPLFHLILASILKMGFSPTVAMKLIMELVVVGGLSLYSWGLTKLFNIKVAFWAMLMLIFSSHFIQLSTTVLPASFVTFLVPALLYFVISKKWLSYSALLTIMFYLHLFMPYFVLLAMLIYLIIFNKKLLKPFILSSAISFVLYLPWLIHIVLGGWEYIKYFDSNTLPDMWKKYVLINFSIVLLAIAGTIILFKKRKELPNQYFFFFIISLLILAPSFMMASRLIDGHFLVFVVILSTLVISEIWKSKWRSVLALPFVFYLWFTPTIIVGDVNSLTLTPSTLNYNNYIYARTGFDPAIKFAPIIQAINKKSRNGETITTVITNLDNYPVEKNYRLSISNIFTSQTNLSTLNLRQPEIYRRPLPDITKTKFLLTSNPQNELDSSFFSTLGYGSSEEIAKFVKNNFQLTTYVLSDFDTATYCFYNKSSATFVEKIPKFRFPLLIGDGLLIIFVSMILYDIRKVTKKND